MKVSEKNSEAKYVILFVLSIVAILVSIMAIAVIPFLLFTLLSIVLFFKIIHEHFFKKKKKKETDDIKENSTKILSIPEQKRVVFKEHHFSTMDGEWHLRYSYRNVKCIIENESNIRDRSAAIKKDGDLISVFSDGIKVGYVANKKIADMACDFLQRGEIIKAYFDSPESIYIGFYKNEISEARKYPSKKYKPIRTKSKSEITDMKRYENATGIQENECLELEYDDETETYVIFNDVKEDIGEISKKDSKDLQSKEDQFEFLCFASDVGEDDDFNPIFSVEIYFK